MITPHTTNASSYGLSDYPPAVRNELSHTWSLVPAVGVEPTNLWFFRPALWPHIWATQAYIGTDGRCIHHLKYSMECVGNHFLPRPVYYFRLDRYNTTPQFSFVVAEPPSCLHTINGGSTWLRSKVKRATTFYSTIKLCSLVVRQSRQLRLLWL